MKCDSPLERLTFHMKSKNLQFYSVDDDQNVTVTNKSLISVGALIAYPTK